MRRSYHCEFIQNEKNEPIGFAFGSDAVSEHEWGIDGLRSALGMNTNAIGFDRSIAHDFRFNLSIHERKNEMIVLFEPTAFNFGEPPSIDKLICWNELSCWKDTPIAASWDDSSFGIHVIGAENVRLLKKAVVEPWNDHDVALFVGRFKQEFKAGLIFLRASQMPEDNRKAMREAHLDYIALQKASDKIGIHNKLRKAGKDFFALSPRWAKDVATSETKYPVVYWLNPMHQDINNFGYFTVEELKQWINNCGPIPKKKTRKSKKD